MISQEQFLAQLRILLPALGMLATVLGVKSQTANQIVDTLLTIAGPLMIIGGSVWSMVANTRFNIIASAAKPVTPNAPLPQIILPREEAKLAADLPANVTSK